MGIGDVRRARDNAGAATRAGVAQEREASAVDLHSVGKWVALAGVFLVVIGGILWLAGKWGLPLGRLPGDVNVEGERFSFHFPVVTCIVLSIVLTIVINLVMRFFGK